MEQEKVRLLITLREADCF